MFDKTADSPRPSPDQSFFSAAIGALKKRAAEKITGVNESIQYLTDNMSRTSAMPTAKESYTLGVLGEVNSLYTHLAKNANRTESISGFYPNAMSYTPANNGQPDTFATVVQGRGQLPNTNLSEYFSQIRPIVHNILTTYGADYDRASGQFKFDSNASASCLGLGKLNNGGKDKKLPDSSTKITTTTTDIVQNNVSIKDGLSKWWTKNVAGTDKKPGRLVEWLRSGQSPFHSCENDRCSSCPFDTAMARELTEAYNGVYSTQPGSNATRVLHMKNMLSCFAAGHYHQLSHGGSLSTAGDEAFDRDFPNHESMSTLFSLMHSRGVHAASIDHITGKEKGVVHGFPHRDSFKMPEISTYLALINPEEFSQSNEATY